MKIHKRTSSGLALGLLIGLTLVIGGCAAAPRADGPAAAPAVAVGPAQAAPGYKYVCGCGPACDCDATANKPGRCGCGKPLIYKKVIREDSGYYWVCQGASDELSKDDLFKCADGKPLQAMLKKGGYVCACPADCDCGAASQRNGVCSCGKPMKAAQ